MKSPSLVGAMNHRMNYLVTRQNVVSSNIANVSTPGYLARDVSFSKFVDNGTLGMHLSRTQKNHITGKKTDRDIPGLETTTDNIRLDGNSVKVDEEMLKLNDIQLNFKMVSDLYEKQKQLQQLAIRAPQ